MSVRPQERNSVENSSKNNLYSIIDNVNLNNLNNFYQKDESYFKKRIDHLNVKFYLETEKYLTGGTVDKQKCTDQLFLILFKQISTYIEEIDRLNTLVKEKTESEKSVKERLEDLNNREKEKNSLQLLITNLRATNKMLEKKIQEKTQSEEKLKIEVESLKRQIKTYVDKLQIEMTFKKSLEMTKSRVGNTLITSAQNNITNRKNLEDFINTSGVSASQLNEGMIHQNMRSTSRDSNGNTKMAFRSEDSMNSNLNSGEVNVINLDLMANGNEENGIQSSTQGNNFKITKNISKILNKKRNYSDNNPSQQAKKGLQPGPQINTRYEQQPQNTMKREVTKSSIVHKNNIEINLLDNSGKTPQKQGQPNNIKKQNTLNETISKAFVMKNSVKNFKDLKIIKTIKQKNQKSGIYNYILICIR
jgi:hypothetical protein